MNKLIKSGFIVLAVAAIAGYGTYSYFSDTETSTGNTFEAGAIDLNDGLSETKFTLEDMKPGDLGEGDFDITATSNPYWACMKSTLDTTPENDANEPEVAAGDSSSSTVGELQNYLSFYVWNNKDGNGEYNGNGNNFPDPSQAIDRNLAGPFTLSQMQALGYMPLADNSGASFFGPTALLANQTYNLGYAYCFGTPSHNNYTNITCDGSSDNNNIAQTDGVTGTLEFYAVQSRNNANFTCASMNAAPAPVVDGVISSGEYDGALSMLITNAGDGDVKAKIQGGFLYLAADIVTDTTDNRSISGFNDEFGVNLGKASATDTTIFALGSTNGNGRTVGTIDGYFTNFNTTGHILKALFTSGHRVIEWKIPLSAVPSVATGDSMSIGGATESTDGNSAIYPIGLIWGNNATYGHLLVN